MFENFSVPWFVWLTLAIILFIVFFSVFYRKVRPNEVMIITGLGLKNKPKVIKGSGAFVLPIFQQWDVLDLSAFTLNVSVESNTITQVPLQVEGTATLNMGNDTTMIETAARKFLGVPIEERNSQLSEIVRGQIRGILGDMAPEEVSNKKDTFSKNVTRDLGPLMATMGVEIVSIQINDVTDNNGYIKSLWAEDVANKRAEAEKAEAKAQAAARAVKAEQESTAQEAEQIARQKMAERTKNTALAEAQFKIEQDTEQAKADQAYRIAEAEASKAVIERQGEADAIAAEKQAIIASKQVDIEKQRLEAEIIAKTNAEAEARKINAQTASETAKIETEATALNLKTKSEADAEAKKINAKAEAEIEQTKAEAESFAIEKTSKAKATAIQLNGQAEAEAIRAKGAADAETTAAMSKALQEQGEIVLQQLLIEKLPEIAKVLAEPLGNIKSLTVYDGMDGVTKSSASQMAQTFEMVKNMTGLDMTEIANKRANGTITLEKTPAANELLSKFNKSLPSIEDNPEKYLQKKD